MVKSRFIYITKITNDLEGNIEARAFEQNNISQKILVGCWRAQQNVSKLFSYALEKVGRNRENVTFQDGYLQKSFSFHIPKFLRQNC